MSNASPVAVGNIVGIGATDASPVFSELLSGLGQSESPILFGLLNAIGPTISPIVFGNLPTGTLQSSPIYYTLLSAALPTLLRTDQTRLLLAVVRSVDMNTTSDQPIAVRATTYIIRSIIFTNASIPLTTAQGGVYTGASKTGTPIVQSTQTYSALSSPSKFIEASLDPVVATDVLTSGLVYLSLSTPQGSAATADVYIYGDPVET